MLNNGGDIFEKMKQGSVHTTKGCSNPIGDCKTDEAISLRRWGNGIDTRIEVSDFSEGSVAKETRNENREEFEAVKADPPTGNQSISSSSFLESLHQMLDRSNNFRNWFSGLFIPRSSVLPSSIVCVFSVFSAAKTGKRVVPVFRQNWAWRGRVSDQVSCLPHSQQMP